MSRVPFLFLIVLIAFLGVALLGVVGRAPAFGDDPAGENGAADGEGEPPEAETLPAATRPLLWVVEGEPRIYLFGTIHVPDERVTTLPKVVEEALVDSDVFWAEIPMGPASQQKMAQRALLPEGTSLRDVLPEDLYGRAAAYLEGRSFPITALAGYKPWAVAMTLQVLDILPQLAVSKPLDAVLYARMESAGKIVGGLETPDEQIDLFDTLPDEEQVAFFAKTLEQLESDEGRDKTQLEELVDLYVEGDLEKIHAYTESQIDRTSEAERKLAERLIDDRNVRMAHRILARTAKGPKKTYFVAVGTAHFPGEKGLLALLEAKGKTIHRVGARAAKKPVPPQEKAE